MPKDFDPKKYLEKKVVEDSFLKNNMIAEKPNVSSIETGLRGGLQGISMGFADEAEAKLKSIINKTPYEYELQKSREANKLAQEANPELYTGSEIAGGVGSFFIPGGAIGKGLVKGASLVPKIGTTIAKGLTKTGSAIQGLSPVAKGIGSGSVSGLGYSEGQNVGEIAEDVGVGGAIGGAIPFGLGKAKGLVSKGIEKSKGITDTAVKKGIQGATGVSSELLTEAEKNPKLINKIVNEYQGLDIKKDLIPEKATQISNFFAENSLGKRINQNYEKAVGLIPDDLRIDKTKALKLIDDEIIRLSETQGLSKIETKAIDDLSHYRNALANIGDDVSIPGNKIRSVLKAIDKDVKEIYGGYGNPFANSDTHSGLTKVRYILDNDLKVQLPEYRKLMEKVSKDMQVNNNLTKRFMDKQGINEKQIQSQLKRQIANEDPRLKKELRRISALSRIEDQEPLNINQFLNDMKMKQNIEQYGGKGSSLSNKIVGLASGAGATIGGLPGMVIGTGLGSVLGSEFEKKGGQIALKALEKTKGLRQPMQNQMNPTLGNLGRSVSQGSTSALNDFLSQQRSEVNRRKMMEERGAKN